MQWFKCLLVTRSLHRKGIILIKMPIILKLRNFSRRLHILIAYFLIHRKEGNMVDKQCTHFFGVTIGEQQAQVGIVVRATSTAQINFKKRRLKHRVKWLKHAVCLKLH